MADECDCLESCRLDDWSDQFVPATRELLVFTKSAKRYFDLDAVREPSKTGNRVMWQSESTDGSKVPGNTKPRRNKYVANNPLGSPPLDWWCIDPDQSSDLPERKGDPMTATFYVGDAIETMGKLPENSVDLVLTSPPFLALRSYLPADHPDKAKEMGSEATPAEFVDTLLRVMAELRRVLAPHGSVCVELGDTYAGGTGGFEGVPDNRSPHREGMDPVTRGRKPSAKPDHPRFREGYVANDGRTTGRAEDLNQNQMANSGGNGWPLAKSLSLIPESFRMALAYGINPHTGIESPAGKWRIRNVIRWVRPNPPVGALGDKWRPATSELVVATVSGKRFWDDLATRKPSDYHRESLYTNKVTPPGQRPNTSQHTVNGAGAPLLDWWEIPPGGYQGAHYAVFPPELVEPCIKAMCPSKVCRTCGEPRRRVVSDRSEFEKQYALAAHIKERRLALGLSLLEVNSWFGYTPSTHNWETTGKGVSIPNKDDWPVLKDRLGLSSEFDELVYGDRSWTESLIEYEVNGSKLSKNERRTDYGRGGNPEEWGDSRVKASRRVPDSWTDCGHDDYRPGVVLDPFAGSGTTLAVATGHGHDAIGIDIDQRNYDLTVERVGPFLMELV